MGNFTHFGIEEYSVSLDGEEFALPENGPTSGVVHIIDDGAVQRPGAGRAVIYARYSSEKQKAVSIDDQVRVCRKYVRQQGWSLATIYFDREISGRRRDRPAYGHMIEDAKSGAFDVVVTEAIDRLSRRMAHLHDLYDRLTYAGVKFHCRGIGEMTPSHIAILGLVADFFLRDLAEKTKRGQEGRVQKGKVMAGLAYGYRTTQGSSEGAGNREIICEEADVILRIFREYAAGISPETIALRLNDEGIPGPRGRPWRNTTIRGQGRRGTGILNNSLYIGDLVWNRVSYVADPDGHRQAKVNEADKHVTATVPHLRIIDQDLWDQAKVRQDSVRSRALSVASNALNGTHRPKYLLAGLLKCSHCGSTYSIMAKDRYGCANHRRGTAMCSNSKTITRQAVEERVLSALRASLMTPERVREFQREFRKQLKEMQQEAAGRTDFLRKRLAEVKANIENLLRMAEGGNAPLSILDRLREREAEQRRIESELALMNEDNNGIIEIMPNLAEVYARKVADLATSLNDPTIKAEATSAIRGLIEKVVVIPDPDARDGVQLEVHGALAEILALGSGNGPKQKLPGLLGSGSQLSVVAGAHRVNPITEIQSHYI